MTIIPKLNFQRGLFDKGQANFHGGLFRVSKINRQLPGSHANEDLPAPNNFPYANFPPYPFPLRPLSPALLRVPALDNPYCSWTRSSVRESARFCEKMQRRRNSPPRLHGAGRRALISC